MRHHERMLRPGGTVSGPAMFGLADFSVYVAVIAALVRLASMPSPPICVSTS
jgi:acyl-coenzyme A thioesterase PaaI-like protein